MFHFYLSLCDKTGLLSYWIFLRKLKCSTECKCKKSFFGAKIFGSNPFVTFNDDMSNIKYLV